MNSLLNNQQSHDENIIDMESDKPFFHIYGADVEKPNKSFNKGQNSQLNKFLNYKKITTSDEKFQNSINSRNNIPISSEQIFFCQTLLDNNSTLPLKNNFDAFQQSDLSRIPHFFQGCRCNSQKDFSTKEIPEGYLKHQSNILHYHSSNCHKSTKIDNRLKPKKCEKNDMDETKIQQKPLKEFQKQQERNNEIENFYKDKYLKLKEKYKEAKQVISSLQNQLEQKSLKIPETSKKQSQKAIQTHETLVNFKFAQKENSQQSKEIEHNQSINNTKNELFKNLQKKFTIIKEELNKSKTIIENQNQQIFQLQNKISELLLNKTNINSNSQSLNDENKKTTNDLCLISKKGHIHFKGLIKARSKSASKRSSSPIKKTEMPTHLLSQYKYLCNMLNVKSDEFNKQWDKVFRKIADILNSLTALKQSSNPEIFKKQYDDLSKRFNISRLSSRFGRIISDNHYKLYKEVEDLHSSVTKKRNSHLREVILAVIFTNRMINIIKYDSFVNENSLTIFSERPSYTPEILISDIRNSFTTISQDLVYSQNLNKTKKSKI